MEKSNYTKICWYCDSCNWVGVSDSRQHHCMETCICEDCGVDLEEYGCRFIGNPIKLAVFKNGKWIRKRK